MPETLDTRCCIVGGGPAGMMLGLLLARDGIPVVVLEKHGDFLRDFRGDTVHASTLEIIAELGLKQRFDALPQHRVDQLEALFADGPHPLIDLRGLRPFPYMALVPQWDFLNLLAEEARRYPHFTLLMRCEATELLYRDNHIAGVVANRTQPPSHAAPGTPSAQPPHTPLEVRADLVIGCDGRGSRLRSAAGLQPQDLKAPMDVLWFRLPRHNDDPDGTYGVPGKGTFLALINRNDYWQAAFVIPKGSAAQWRARPLAEFQSRIAQRVGFLADRVGSVESWDQVKLLEVRVDRLAQWYRPGLLLIGDAAHAMSPIGGVGINLAIQDAVAAANILAPVLLAPGLPDVAALSAVQKRRMLPTKLTQRVQLFLQRRVIARALAEHDDGTPVELRGALRFLLRFRLIRAIPARIFGVGFRREHVRPPAR